MRDPVEFDPQVAADPSLEVPVQRFIVQLGYNDLAGAAIGDAYAHIRRGHFRIRLDPEQMTLLHDAVAEGKSQFVFDGIFLDKFAGLLQPLAIDPCVIEED